MNLQTKMPVDEKPPFHDNSRSHLSVCRETMDQKNTAAKEPKDRTRLSCLLAYTSSIVLVVGGTLLVKGGGTLGVCAVILGVVLSEFSHYYAAQGGACRALKNLKKD